MEMLRDGSITFITCSPGATRQTFVVIDPQGRRTDGPIAAPPTTCVTGQVLDPRHVFAVTMTAPASVLRADDGGQSWADLYSAVP